MVHAPLHPGAAARACPRRRWKGPLRAAHHPPPPRAHGTLLQGAVTVYKSLISPFMKQHEATFDRAGAAAAGAASSAASSVATEGARYVASNASTIASGVVRDPVPPL